jgi:uncharacterized protein with PIN domain
MKGISIRFFDELTDLLPRSMREGALDIPFMGRRSVKDLIESLHVPHTEVGSIRVNGGLRDLSYVLEPGDGVEVYPAQCPPEPVPGEAAFVCDVHLGKLARFLRILGFDVDFANHRDDAVLARISQQDNRILLTRDRRLLMRGCVCHGQLIRSTDVELQIKEVIRRFDLKGRCRPFSRCPACNGLLQKMDDREPSFGEYRNRVPPGVRQWNREYAVCPACRKVYWKGSHYDRLQRRLAAYLK